MLRRPDPPDAHPLSAYAVPVSGGECDAWYFRIVADYIHLNPARAGLAGGNRGTLASYRWTSLRRVHQIEAAPMVYPHLSCFGDPIIDSRIIKWLFGPEACLGEARTDHPRPAPHFPQRSRRMVRQLPGFLHKQVADLVLFVMGPDVFASSAGALTSSALLDSFSDCCAH